MTRDPILFRVDGTSRTGHERGRREHMPLQRERGRNERDRNETDRDGKPAHRASLEPQIELIPATGKLRQPGHETRQHLGREHRRRPVSRGRHLSDQAVETPYNAGRGDHQASGRSDRNDAQ